MSRCGSAQSQLVLSIFPGIDLLGRGFEIEGFCVVRGPDIIYGGDIRTFHPAEGVFDGVIGGPPCQDFSKVRRTAPTGEGLEMLDQFARVVTEAHPMWFLMENVPTVPDISVPGYYVRRFDLNANECGLSQNRPRHFQYGDLRGNVVIIERSPKIENTQPCCMASEGAKPNRRSWPDFCELQGLPRDFSLPEMSTASKYRAVGNGVPVPMARLIARAIQVSRAPVGFRLCNCGCGRPVGGRHNTASDACRKRLQRKRDRAGVTLSDQVTLFDL